MKPRVQKDSIRTHATVPLVTRTTTAGLVCDNKYIALISLHKSVINGEMLCFSYIIQSKNLLLKFNNNNNGNNDTTTNNNVNMN